MISSIKIGDRTFITKRAAKMFLTDQRENGVTAPGLEAFFSASAPVESRYNAELQQTELWSGEQRLSIKRAIDRAFAGGDPVELARIRRRYAVERARDIIHQSARRAHLDANPACVSCGSTTRLEADHLGHTQFKVLWRQFVEQNRETTFDGEIVGDDDAWLAFHDERARFQTLCKPCHIDTTAARRYSSSSGSE